MKKAVAIVAGAVGFAIVAAALAFAFGTPQAPSVSNGDVPAAQAQASTPVPASQGADAPVVPAPAEEKAPFAVQIPGCRCHSDNPEVVERHSKYRMSECRSCHAGDSPGMGGQ
ncbi:MAG: hypothetical protein KGZ40_05150 [Clostridiales bacterium]|nr:hypothetical protein [Clostridiales bacterium]